MQHLDNGSIVIAVLLVSSLMALLVSFITARSIRSGLPCWRISNWLFALGFVLLLGRGIIPDWASILVANGALIATVLLISETVKSFGSGKGDRRVALGIGALFLVGFSVLLFVFDSRNGRGIVMFSLVAASATLALHRLRNVPPISGRSILLWTFRATFAVAVILALGYLFKLLEIDHPPLPDSGQPGISLFFLAVFVAWNIGVLVLLLSASQMELASKVLEIGQSRNELDTLYAMYRATHEVEGLEALFARIFAELKGIVRADTAGLYLVEDGDLRLVAYDGFSTELAERLKRAKHRGTATTAAFRRRAPQLVHAEDNRDPELRVIIALQCMESFISIPLLEGPECIGVVTLGFRMRQVPGAERAELYGSIGSILGSAIRNAKLKQELRDAALRLEEQARTDPLTGLLNRRAMRSALEREVERSVRYGTRASLVMADIDDFKTVNDSKGHDCGDAGLVFFSGALTQAARAADSVSRWGGEEFLLLLPQTDSAGATAFADRLRGAIAGGGFVCRGSTVHIRASFGVAELDPAAGIDLSLSRADDALYRAKALGKDRVVPWEGELS